MAYQSDDLLADIRRTGSLASASVTGTADADLLAEADQELRDTLVPLMLGANENLYERAFDISVTSGLGAYRLNKRISLSRVNSVVWLNSDNTGYSLERIDYKRSIEMGVTATQQSQPRAFYLDGGRLVLWPTPQATGTLRVRAFVRPGKMALAAATGSKACTAVSGSLSTTFVLTIATGHGYTTSTPLDVVAATPSFEHLALDVTPSATTATSVTLAGSSFVTAPEVGDFVCAPDTSPYPQIPVELHPALVELVVARRLRGQGALGEAQAHAREAERLVAIGIQALTPRVDTAERKLVGGPHWRYSRNPLTWVGP